MNLNTRQRKVVEATESKILCLAAAGSGKAQPNSLIIPTPNGKRKIGDIKVGDYLFDRKGNPTKILGVYPQGEKEVFEITFGDGRKTLCCEEHIWRTYNNGNKFKYKNSYKDLTVKEIIKRGITTVDSRGHHSSRFSIPCSSPVLYSNLQDLTVDPYLFGVFLSDGCCRERILTLSSNDKEIVDNIVEILQCQVKKQKGNNYSWNFYSSEGKPIHTEEIMKEYKKYICCYSYEKSIPDNFKYTSIENRYSLVQGLMDTDGSIIINNNRYTVKFHTTSTKLRDDFIEIMGSLGYICTYREDTREKYTLGKAYEISINISNSEKYKLFRLTRKKEIALQGINQKQNRNYDRTTIKQIRSLGYKEDMTCFYVDNDEHLYLTNDFIVTHNTTVLTERIKHLVKIGCKPEDIIAISFTNMAADEMKERLGDNCNGMFIGTIHSLANSICIANGINTERYIADANFDMILKKALTVPRGRFPQVKHVLVDEFQDICEADWKFLEKIRTENFFVVADERQEIFQFRGGSSQYLYNLYNDITCKVYNLTENYRCAPNILNFADNLISSMNKISLRAIAVKKENGYINDNCIFSEALEQMEWEGDWGNWFILCRTNNELVTAMEILEKREIPYVSFKKGDLDLLEMNFLLKDNKVKLLTIHSSKGLQSKHVIVTGARMWSEEERKIAYVAATRAEQSLYWTPSIYKGRKRAENRDKADAGRVFEKASKGMMSFE